MWRDSLSPAWSSSQVDAFTAEAFKGNPAAMCVLEDAARAADAVWMQAVAAEFNVSQTAFLLREDSSSAAAAPHSNSDGSLPIPRSAASISPSLRDLTADVDPF
jgi:hypothetical protein